MVNSSDLQLLRDVVGPSGIATDESALDSYVIPARYSRGKAAAVVLPRDTRELSQVIGICVRRRIQFIPQGANTGLVEGSTPDTSGEQVVISLERHRRIDLNVADRTAVAGAGVRLSALNQALLEHDLCFPIDVSSDPMVGGMVSTNTGGSRYLRYGDMRRQVLGLQVVLPDEAGTILDLSHGLRKDNTHLDLKSIFIGTSGALGIVAAATLEVHRRPRQVAVALLIPRAVDAIGELLAAFEENAGEYLSAFEGMSGRALQHAFRHIKSLHNPFDEGVPEYAVLVELSSTAAPRPGELALEAVLVNVVEQIAAGEKPPIDNAYFGNAERFWAIRHSLSEALRSHGRVIGLDLSFQRDRVFAFRAQANALLTSEFPDFQACDFGHIADGGLHYNIVCTRPFGDDEAARVRERMVGLAVETFRGSFSGEHGIGRANVGEYLRYVPAIIQRYSSNVAAIFTTFPSANAVIRS